jgi:hypothetical protein
MFLTLHWKGCTSFTCSGCTIYYQRRRREHSSVNVKNTKQKKAIFFRNVLNRQSTYCGLGKLLKASHNSRFLTFNSKLVNHEYNHEYCRWNNFLVARKLSSRITKKCPFLCVSRKLTNHATFSNNICLSDFYSFRSSPFFATPVYLILTWR